MHRQADPFWGIAAISDSKFFAEDATYILSGFNTWGWVTLILGILQNTWGWVTLILGILQVLAGFSLFSYGLLVRHLRRKSQRDRGAAIDSGLSVLVTGGLRA